MTSGRVFVAMDRLLDTDRFDLSITSGRRLPESLVIPSCTVPWWMDDLHAWVIMPNHVHSAVRAK
jgi:hypothetical protein